MLSFLDPSKHIVYRSQAEAVADEFWWSPGHFTATKMGDGFVIFILLIVATILGIKIYAHFFDRWNKMTVPKLLLSILFFIPSTVSLFYLLYYFVQ